MTNVIHIRDVPPNWESNPDFAYIGRPGKGKDGYFGNPTRLTPGQPRGATLEKFKEYFEARLASDPDFKARVDGLRGKTLVCFCSPARCHGDVIAEHLDKDTE
jgi:hypothetical protein